MPLDLVLERFLQEEAPADSRDGNLVMALTYGITRERRYLDRIIALVASHPLEKMKPRTINALRLGVFQLFFMDKIPASAAINETIQALKKSRQPKWLTNFCNGVLRNIARQKKDLLKTAAGKMTPAERFSHPDWLYERWQNRYGQTEAEKICRTNNMPPHLSLRINQHKTSAAEFIKELARKGIEAQPGKYTAHCLHLDYSGPITELPGYRQGLFHVQDEGAQLIVDLFQPLDRGAYLDCCAGLGGKTMQLAAMMPPGSSLTAIEPHETRVGQLKTNLQRLGLEQKVSIFAMGLEEFAAQSKTLFNYVLVDAPCSGLGVIRRHPDIRWNRRPHDLATLRQGQLKLLTCAAGLLDPTGVLVYATCSTEPEENEEVARRFLEDHPQFIVARPQMPGAKAEALIDQDFFFRTLPAPAHDGFFAIKFVNRKTT